MRLAQTECVFVCAFVDRFSSRKSLPVKENTCTIFENFDDFSLLSSPTLLYALLDVSEMSSLVTKFYI